MKDVKQCSISSIAFTLEVDAYDTLYNYIESIRSRYDDNPDGEEILSDIEARIAELILSVHSADRVVAKPLVDNIISQLGSVDEICPEEQTTGSEEAKTDKGESTKQSRGKRQLYRNIDDAPIGGVCSGIAAYIGCNVAIVRAIALLLVLCGGASIWLYIILWIVMPAAVTARQKLEMRGEPITVSTIKDFYESYAEKHVTKSYGVISSILTFIGHLLMLLFKIFVVLILIALLLALIGVVVGAFAVIVMHDDLFSWAQFAVSLMALCSIAMLLSVGIYTSLQIIGSRPVKGKAIGVTLVVWLILTIATAISVALLQPDIRWNDKISINRERGISCEGDSSSDKMEKLEELEELYNGSTSEE